MRHGQYASEPWQSIYEDHATGLALTALICLLFSVVPFGAMSSESEAKEQAIITEYLELMHRADGDTVQETELLEELKSKISEKKYRAIIKKVVLK